MHVQLLTVTLYYYVVTEAHILAVAMTHFNMKSLDDVSSAVLIPENSDLCSLDI